jgi:uncharacterized protein (DUF1330 family)
MAYGYVIAQINVTDPDRYTDYVAMASKLVEQFGGEFLVRGGQGESFEGTPPGARNVVIRFPDVKAARNWYHSDDYAEAKALRMSASTSVQTIVEGV